MFLEILEERNAVGLEERHLAGLDSMEEFLPGVPHPVLVDHERPAVHGGGDARLKRRSERREFEPSALGLGEDADARQRAEDTVERRRLNARGCRQIFGGARTLLEEVGQLEFRGDVNEARDPVSDGEVPHDFRR